MLSIFIQLRQASQLENGYKRIFNWISIFNLTLYRPYTGLEKLIREVRGRGEQVIRRDLLIKQHGLNERQAKALAFLIQHGNL